MFRWLKKLWKKTKARRLRLSRIYSVRNTLPPKEAQLFASLKNNNTLYLNNDIQDIKNKILETSNLSDLINNKYLNNKYANKDANSQKDQIVKLFNDLWNRYQIASENILKVKMQAKSYQTALAEASKEVNNEETNLSLNNVGLTEFLNKYEPTINNLDFDPILKTKLANWNEIFNHMQYETALNKNHVLMGNTTEFLAFHAFALQQIAGVNLQANGLLTTMNGINTYLENNTLNNDEFNDLFTKANLHITPLSNKYVTLNQLHQNHINTSILTKLNDNTIKLNKTHQNDVYDLKFLITQNQLDEIKTNEALKTSLNTWNDMNNSYGLLSKDVNFKTINNYLNKHFAITKKHNNILNQGFINNNHTNLNSIDNWIDAFKNNQLTNLKLADASLINTINDQLQLTNNASDNLNKIINTRKKAYHDHPLASLYLNLLAGKELINLSKKNENLTDFQLKDLMTSTIAKKRNNTGLDYKEFKQQEIDTFLKLNAEISELRVKNLKFHNNYNSLSKLYQSKMANDLTNSNDSNLKNDNLIYLQKPNFNILYKRFYLQAKVAMLAYGGLKEYGKVAFVATSNENNTSNNAITNTYFTLNQLNPELVSRLKDNNIAPFTYYDAVLQNPDATNNKSEPPIVQYILNKDRVIATNPVELAFYPEKIDLNYPVSVNETMQLYDLTMQKINDQTNLNDATFTKKFSSNVDYLNKYFSQVINHEAVNEYENEQNDHLIYNTYKKAIDNWTREVMYEVRSSRFEWTRGYKVDEQDVKNYLIAALINHNLRNVDSSNPAVLNSNNQIRLNKILEQTKQSYLSNYTDEVLSLQNGNYKTSLKAHRQASIDLTNTRASIQHDQLAIQRLRQKITNLGILDITSSKNKLKDAYEQRINVLQARLATSEETRVRLEKELYEYRFKNNMVNGIIKVQLPAFIKPNLEDIFQNDEANNLTSDVAKHVKTAINDVIVNGNKNTIANVIGLNSQVYLNKEDANQLTELEHDVNRELDVKDTLHDEKVIIFKNFFSDNDSLAVKTKNLKDGLDFGKVNSKGNTNWYVTNADMTTGFTRFDLNRNSVITNENMSNLFKDASRQNVQLFANSGIRENVARSSEQLKNYFLTKKDLTSDLNLINVQSVAINNTTFNNQLERYDYANRYIANSYHSDYVTMNNIYNEVSPYELQQSLVTKTKPVEVANNLNITPIETISPIETPVKEPTENLEEGNIRTDYLDNLDDETFSNMLNNATDDVISDEPSITFSEDEPAISFDEPEPIVEEPSKPVENISENTPDEMSLSTLDNDDIFNNNVVTPITPTTIELEPSGKSKPEEIAIFDSLQPNTVQKIVEPAPIEVYDTLNTKPEINPADIQVEVKPSSENVKKLLIALKADLTSPDFVKTDLYRWIRKDESDLYNPNVFMSNTPLANKVGHFFNQRGQIEMNKLMNIYQIPANDRDDIWNDICDEIANAEAYKKSIVNRKMLLGRLWTRIDQVKIYSEDIHNRFSNLDSGKVAYTNGSRQPSIAAYDKQTNDSKFQKADNYLTDLLGGKYLDTVQDTLNNIKENEQQMQEVLNTTNTKTAVLKAKFTRNKQRRYYNLEPEQLDLEDSMTLTR